MALRQLILRRIRQLGALPRRAATYPSSHRRPSDGPPIFILGCPRSGTTLVRKILNSHSRIACPGESWFLYPLLQQLANPDIRAGLESLDVYRPELVKNIRAWGLHFFEGYLYRTGKARWADKSPLYTLVAEQVVEVFGDVRIIHCLRHGMDVAHSMRDMQGVRNAAGNDAGLSERLQAAARVWLDFTGSMDRAQSAHPELVHTIRYEHLTQDPETVMRGVLDFLGEAWEPGILDYQAHQQSGVGDPKSSQFEGIVAGNTDKYLAWDPETRARVVEILGPQLTRYGYIVAEG